MNDPNAERMLRKYKGFTNAIKLMLKQEYKFLGGDNIQDMFVQDLLKEFNKHLKDGWKLDASQDDLKLRLGGYSAKEIRRNAHDFKSPMRMKMDESHIYEHLVYSIMRRDN